MRNLVRNWQKGNRKREGLGDFEKTANSDIRVLLINMAEGLSQSTKNV